MMSNNRSLLIGGVGLVKGQLREAGRAMLSICDELEPYFASENLLDGAPFDSISLVLRYGTKYSESAEISGINEQHSELEVAYELPMNDLRNLGYEALRAKFRQATLDSLIRVSKEFGLPVHIWERLREQA